MSELRQTKLDWFLSTIKPQWNNKHDKRNRPVIIICAQCRCINNRFIFLLLQTCCLVCFSLAEFVLFLKSTIYFTSLTWEETSRKWNTHHPPIVHRNIYDFIFNTHQNFTSNYHFSSYRVYLFDENNSHENRKRFARFNSHSQDQARLWMSC